MQYISLGRELELIISARCTLKSEVARGEWDNFLPLAHIRVGPHCKLGVV